MIVFYNQENTLSLPYNVVVRVQQRNENHLPIFDKDGNPKMVNKNTAKYFKFVPGKNIISNELWLKIVDYNKEDWDYYSSILSIFKPKIDATTKAEVGEDESKIDLRSLNPKEFKDLIENTMELDDINKYMKFERSNDNPRPQILKAIKKRQNQITKADEALAKQREED